MPQDEVISTTSARDKLRAEFVKEDGRDYIKISILGDSSTIIRKVTPEDTVRFAAEWESYQKDGVPIEVDGTPLTEVPGVDKSVALALRLKGVRTAEELANLDEAAAKSLGMSGLTWWNGARNLIKLRQLEAQAMAPRRGRPPKAEGIDAGAVE